MVALTLWVDIDVDVPPDLRRIFTLISALVSVIICAEQANVTTVR